MEKGKLTVMSIGSNSGKCSMKAANILGSIMENIESGKKDENKIKKELLTRSLLRKKRREKNKKK
ncbi:MAG: hypothetical protein ACRCX2_27950 [Paraclostridium sp.]